MTDTKIRKHRKLSHELLGMIALSAAIALLLFLLLSGAAATIAEIYCFRNDIEMTEFDWIDLDRIIFSCSAILSCICFSVLFLNLLHERIVYIRKITDAIGILQTGQQTLSIPLEGRNELTNLAAAINEMSAAQQKIREKEAALQTEKEQLIRALSHDIRTPLTSILAYSNYLIDNPHLTPTEQKNYLGLIQKKSERIRDLTAILLEGGKRNPEPIEDVRLLMEQIAAEFESNLEDRFSLWADLSDCPTFSGCFDVQELRRIFDNLSSNIQKYADPAHPVTISIRLAQNTLQIQQSNRVLADAPQSEGYQIGLHSIRRIAQLYGGQVTVDRNPDQFSICITLSDF